MSNNILSDSNTFMKFAGNAGEIIGSLGAGYCFGKKFLVGPGVFPFVFRMGGTVGRYAALAIAAVPAVIVDIVGFGSICLELSARDRQNLQNRAKHQKFMADVEERLSLRGISSSSTAVAVRGIRSGRGAGTYYNEISQYTESAGDSKAESAPVRRDDENTEQSLPTHMPSRLSK